MFRIYVYKYIYKIYIYIRFIWPQSSLNIIKQISEERPVRRAAPMDGVSLHTVQWELADAFPLYTFLYEFYSPPGASEVRSEMLAAWHSKSEGYFFLKFPGNLLNKWREILFWNLPSEIFLWNFPLTHWR